MSESFFVSNVAPRVGAGFNRGICAACEEKSNKQNRRCVRRGM